MKTSTFSSVLVNEITFTLVPYRHDIYESEEHLDKVCHGVQYLQSFSCICAYCFLLPQHG